MYLHIYNSDGKLHAVLCDDAGEPTSEGLDFVGGVSLDINTGLHVIGGPEPAAHVLGNVVLR